MTYVEIMREPLRKIGDIQATATDNLIGAKKRSKRYYDLKSNPQHIQVRGDVYLLKEPRVSKLDAHYIGPFILEQLPGESNVQIRINQNKIKITHLDKFKLAALPVILENEP